MFIQRNFMARAAGVAFILAILSLLAFAIDSQGRFAWAFGLFGWLILAAVVLMALEGVVRLLRFVAGSDDAG